MKIGVYFSDEICGTAFFDGDKCVGYVHENDGAWSSYFNSIFKKMKIEIEELYEISPKQEKSLKKKYEA